MTPSECVDLIEFINGRCPAMRMQANTPQTWYVDLVGYDLTDALEAARRTTLGQTFIGIGDLVRECEAIVRSRIGQQRLAEINQQVAAENPPAELHSRPVAALTAGQAVPYDDPARAERRAQLRKAAHTKRQRTGAETAAKAEHDRHRTEAQAELDAMRSTG